MGSKIIDLTGQTFGHWTVIKYIENDKHNARLWLCQCDCEKQTIKKVRTADLTSGKSSSCGCTKGQIFVKDLTEKKYGKLTVIKRYGHRDNIITWLCRCECGNEVVVKGSYLTAGHTKSCGCIKKSNTYIFKDEYVIGITEEGEEFYFDLEDYEKVKQYTWYIKSDGYVESSIYDGYKSETISLHRLVMNAQKGEQVDHKDHGVNDCRKYNLRKCTVSQNQMNKKIQKNNTSGVTGVCWNESRSNWKAYISLNKKKITLGYFKDFNEAVKVRREAENIYHKEYAYNNNEDVRIRRNKK